MTSSSHIGVVIEDSSKFYRDVLTSFRRHPELFTKIHPRILPAVHPAKPVTADFVLSLHQSFNLHHSSTEHRYRPRVFLAIPGTLSGNLLGPSFTPETGFTVVVLAANPDTQTLKTLHILVCASFTLQDYLKSRWSRTLFYFPAKNLAIHRRASGDMCDCLVAAVAEFFSFKNRTCTIAPNPQQISRTCIV